MSQAFFVPTRVFSGTGCLATHSSILKSLGTKALIVTGRHSAVSSGAGADVVAALEAAGIASVLYEKIPPNPGFTEVREAAKLARAEGADFVVGIGGGLLGALYPLGLLFALRTKSVREFYSAAVVGRVY